MIQLAVPRVLVIEDDAGARSALASLLADDGYAVCTAATGMDGIGLADEFRPHAIVCDYSLPDVDGLSVMRRLRATYPDLFFIMVTAGRFDPTGERDLRAEADVFLDKPVDLSALRSALVRATAETGTGRAFN
jgi:CheY-like chemotaxis protein